MSLSPPVVLIVSSPAPILHEIDAADEKHLRLTTKLLNVCHPGFGQPNQLGRGTDPHFTNYPPAVNLIFYSTVPGFLFGIAESYVPFVPRHVSAHNEYILDIFPSRFTASFP